VIVGKQAMRFGICQGAFRVRSGFSLLETLTAVVIFSVAIVALIEGIAANSRVQAWIESQSRAMMIAQNIMEEIEYVGEMRVGTDGGQFPDDPRFTWTSEILETDYETLFEVRVTVLWMEGEAQRDYQLLTYMRAREQLDEWAEDEEY
jgi:type II secretion system protein I